MTMSLRRNSLRCQFHDPLVRPNAPSRSQRPVVRAFLAGGSVGSSAKGCARGAGRRASRADRHAPGLERRRYRSLLLVPAVAGHYENDFLARQFLLLDVRPQRCRRPEQPGWRHKEHSACWCQGKLPDRGLGDNRGRRSRGRRSYRSASVPRGRLAVISPRPGLRGPQRGD